MGKADKNAVKNDITTERDRSQTQSNYGTSNTQDRVNQLLPRSDAERSNVLSGYSNMATTGGLSSDDANNLRNASSLRSGSSSGGSSGGSGGNTTPGQPSYLDTFKELLNPSGAWDSTRLSNVEGAAGKLYDTSGNYGDVNSSISKLQNTRGNYGISDKSAHSLQDFAATGGLSADDLAQIRRPLYDEFEKTGGYSAGDIGNIRSRSDAGISSTYGALRDQLNRNRITSGNVGPGLSSADFKLARQGAQDIGTNRRNTEVDIANNVRTGRMDAAKQISANQLALQPIKNQATLSGYGTAADIDLTKNRQVDAAMEAAGKLGLTRQQQIDMAMEAAAGIDTGVQGLTNNTRLAAAGGLSQDTLGRMSIGSNSGAMQAALDAQNERFLIQQRDQNKQFGMTGMLDTYKAAPTELNFNQDLLRNYRNDNSNQQQGLISARTNQGYMPGLGSDISTGLGIAGQVAGLGAGMFGPLGSYGSNLMKPKPVGIPMGAG